MTRAIRTTAVVGEGGRLSIPSSDLAPGTRVEIIVLEETGVPLRSIRDILAAHEGRALFKSAAEVDAYLDAERASWDR